MSKCLKVFIKLRRLRVRWLLVFSRIVILSGVILMGFNLLIILWVEKCVLDFKRVYEVY